MAGPVSRRAVLAGAGGLAASAFAPAGLRLSTLTKRDLWRRRTGPHLRGAVFVQRRVYPRLDGDSFLGRGALGPPVTDQVLDQLTEIGANLASWSGPGIFRETGDFAIDSQVEDHIALWLDRCRTRGLYTTLCLRSGPGRSALAFHPDETWYPAELYDDSVWRSAEKQAAWAEMVDAMLARFGDHPALAGIVPMEEPNGADLGLGSVWPALAKQIAERALTRRPGVDTPLLFSPDRWARVEAAADLRVAIGADYPLVLHHYDPWEYTHQNQASPLRYQPEAMSAPEFGTVTEDWSVLEFGAVRHAPGIQSFLQDRIDHWEGMGANWAAFRWSSGWSEYERAEGGMTLSLDTSILAVLRQAFAQNRVRPG